MGKFRAKRMGKYASQAEGWRAKVLIAMEAQGLISGLLEQQPFVISPEGCEPIKYVADFTYIDTKGLISGVRHAQICDDTKGRFTALFTLKGKLFRHFFPHYKFVLSKGKYRKNNVTKKLELYGFDTFDYPNTRTQKHLSTQNLGDYIDVREPTRRKLSESSRRRNHKNKKAIKD